MSEDSGTIHIVTGAAGAGFSTNLQSPQPKWIQFVSDSNHGYVRAKITGKAEKKTLQLDFVEAVGRKVIDSVTIKSKFPGANKNNQADAAAAAPKRQRNAPKIVLKE